ncbi:MAG: hypothetical protein JXB48_14175 [Candidatus Latescibacteria bacterium]|nr:hypothetical protein [Candidatus Latescibacterota bacterium]
MKNTTVLWISVLIIFAYGFILTGCNTAPNDKINALNEKMQVLNKSAAEYFAPDEYASLTILLTDINVYTEKKQFKKVSETADSVFATLDRIQIVLQTTGKTTAEKSLAEANAEINTLTDLLSEQNTALLGREASTIYLQEYNKYKDQLATLDTEFQGAFYYRVHKRALELIDEIKDTRARIEHKISSVKL